MDGTFTNIYHRSKPNVGEYPKHGAYEIYASTQIHRTRLGRPISSSELLAEEKSLSRGTVVTFGWTKGRPPPPAIFGMQIRSSNSSHVCCTLFFSQGLQFVRFYDILWPIYLGDRYRSVARKVIMCTENDLAWEDFLWFPIGLVVALFLLQGSLQFYTRSIFLSTIK